MLISRFTLTDNGISDDSPILEYLDWAGIRTKNSLAMSLLAMTKITEWTEKFANEITFGTPEKKIHIPIEEHRKGLLACLIATWNVCRDDFTAARQSKLPMTPAATAPSASTIPATSSDEKIPKTLAHKGIYQQLITDYKVSTGNTKTFPEKILLGAEQVVVRMWHEHTVSKNYQAVGLGEIITKRTFTATGSVNSTAKRDKSDKTLVLNPDDHTLVQQEQKDWDPQSMMMILDSLDAIRWAWILIQISNQESIDTYIERFIQLTRKNPQRLANVKEAWDTFSWTIAMQMRNNMTSNRLPRRSSKTHAVYHRRHPFPTSSQEAQERERQGQEGQGQGQDQEQVQYVEYQSQIPAIPIPTIQPCGFPTNGTIGHSTLSLWPTTPPPTFVSPQAKGHHKGDKNKGGHKSKTFSKSQK